MASRETGVHLTFETSLFEKVNISGSWTEYFAGHFEIVTDAFSIELSHLEQLSTLRCSIKDKRR